MFKTRTLTGLLVLTLMVIASTFAEATALTSDSADPISAILGGPYGREAQPMASVPASRSSEDAAIARISLEPLAGVSWPMFKNQASRLGNNPQETTINNQNAKFLSLSWVGLLGDIVDTSSPAVVNGVVYIQLVRREI